MYPDRRVSLCASLCLLSFRLLALVQVAKGDTPTREEIEQAWRTRYCQLVALTSSERTNDLITTYGSYHGEYGFSTTDVLLESAVSEKAETFTVSSDQFPCSMPPTPNDYTWCVRLMVPSHNVTSCVSDSGRTESEAAHVLGIGDNMDLRSNGHLRLRNVSRIYFYAMVSAIVHTGSCNRIVSFVLSIKDDASNIGRFNTVIPDKTWVVGRPATAECSYITTKPSHYLSLYRNNESLPFIFENPHCTSNCMVDNRTIAQTLRMNSTRVYYWWQTSCYSSEKTLHVTLEVDNVSNADVGLYRCRVEAEGEIIVNESPVANITLFNDIIEIEPFTNTSVDVDVGGVFSRDCRSKALDDRDWKTVWIAPSGDIVPEVTTDTNCGSETAPKLFSQVRTKSREEGGVSKEVQTLTLFICSMDERYDGLYTCRVENEMDVANETIVVNVQPVPRSTDSSEIPSVVVGVIVAVITLFVLLAVVTVMSCVLYFRYKNRMNREYRMGDDEEDAKYPSPSKSDITAIHSPSEKRSGLPVDINSPSDERNINTIDGGENVCLVRVDNMWNYPQERFSVIGELGSGQYGRVVHASAPGILREQPGKDKVAAKTVKDHARPQDLQSICEEIELMAAIDPHTNILNLLGYTIKDQRPYLIMEYAKHGDLHRLLKKCKEEMKRQSVMRCNSGSTSSSGYYNVDSLQDRLLSSSSGICSPVSSVPAGTPVLPSISEDQNKPGGVIPFTIGDDTVFESDVAYIKSPGSCAAHNIRPLHREYHNYPHELIPEDILNFALQIAQGMEHLHKNNIIHRDLAARNILITEDCVLKIADFGLARVKDDNDYYKIATERGLPIRWTAPEVFRKFKYSSKSDVWSYAILLWEITSYGDTPFREYGFSDLSRHLENGGRPRREAVCNDELFELMKDCWSLIPQDRPSFKEITRRLSLESCPSSPMAVKYSPGLQGGDVPPHIASSLTHTSPI